MAKYLFFLVFFVENVFWYIDIDFHLLSRIYGKQSVYSFAEMPYFCNPFADVAKLADAPDLGSGAVRHVGSTPIIRTKKI